MLVRSASAIWSGPVTIQLVTALTSGTAGAGAGTAAFPRKRARYWRSLRRSEGPRLIDRELYRPRSWTGNKARPAAGQVPEETPFRTKPQLLEQMTEPSVAAGIPFGWGTADKAYVDNGPPRDQQHARRWSRWSLNHGPPQRTAVHRIRHCRAQSASRSRLRLQQYRRRCLHGKLA
jgi:DDE superfamily endonuclease